MKREKRKPRYRCSCRALHLWASYRNTDPDDPVYIILKRNLRDSARFYYMNPDIYRKDVLRQ